MEQVTTFLMGLNECYAFIKSQIMLMTPLSTLRKACSFVQQEREVRRMTHSEVTKQSIFLAKGVQGGSSYQKTGEKQICSHCNFIGHTVDTCYKLHGYPPSWNGRNNRRQGSTSGRKPMAAATTSTNEHKCFSVDTP